MPISFCRCQICQYASRNSSQLIVHLRTHTGDAPFQCQLCSSKFKINSDLKRHARLHTGEKPFRCEHCEYRCAIKGKRIDDTDGIAKCVECSRQVLVCQEIRAPRFEPWPSQSNDLKMYYLSLPSLVCGITRIGEVEWEDQLPAIEISLA